MEHPLLVPHGGTVSVRWLADGNGVCHARDYYNANPECKAALLAQARQISIKGRVGKVPENGHYLEGEFSELYELKPGDHRFMGFRRGSDFYLAYGAAKKSKVRAQEADYRTALELKQAFDVEFEKQAGAAKRAR